MKKLIKKINHSGIHKGISPQEAKYIISTNTSAIAVAVFTLPYMPFYYFNAHFMRNVGIIFIFVVCFVLYPLTIYFNYKCKYLLAKFIFFTSGYIQLVCIQLSLDKKAGLDLYILGAIIVPFLLIPPKQKWLLLITEALLVCLYFIAQYIYSFWTPILKLRPNELQIFYYINTSLIIFWFIYQGYHFYNQTNTTEKIIETERKKSDKLLLNILPEEIADELKSKKKSEPKYYEQVTVLFTDFHGFTKIAEQMSPRELVAELDRCFSQFDSITERFHLEKLKTIGDSFMCAGGLPLANKSNPVDAALAALEIRNFMLEIQNIRRTNNLPYWELRIGLHTGPLVAGVIGSKKFAYDVWGDTVNTASRMESAGTSGKINISADTYELLKDFFDCEYRGMIDVKNKGKIDMYFLHQIKPDLSHNGEGKAPGELFHSLYKEKFIV